MSEVEREKHISSAWSERSSMPVVVEAIRTAKEKVIADANEWNDVDAVVAVENIVAWKGGSYGEGEHCFL